MSKNGFAIRILVVTCVAHLVTHMVMLLFSPVMELMAQDFSIEATDIAFYFALANIFLGLGAIPSGWLGDRFGEKKLLSAFFLLCAAATSLIGLATTTTLLVIGCVVLGVATSIFHPVANALIAKGIQARGRAMGINGIAGSLGTALGPLYAGLVVSHFTWREAYWSIGVPCLLFGIALLFVDLGPASQPVAKKSENATTTTHARGNPQGVTVVLFVLLISAMTFGALFYYMFTTILPEFLAQHGAFDSPDGEPSLAQQSRDGGVKAGIALTFGAIGQIVGGILSDRYNARKLYVGIYIILAPMVFALGFLEGFSALACACAASMIYFGVQPIENIIIAQFTPARWKGTVYGLKFTLVFGVGGGVGTWGVKALQGARDMRAIFVVSGIFIVVALACAIGASRISARSQ